MAYTVQQFESDIEAGAYAWPGGYPQFFVTSDGGALSFEAAKTEAHQIKESIAGRLNDGWRVTACLINWEDESLYCDHSGAHIESAYGADIEAGQ